MKFYLDENLSPRLAHALRARGIDAVSAHEAGRAGLDDPAQLRHATAEGRAIVTLDIADFVALDAVAIAGNEPHAGIVLIPRRLVGRHEAEALADAIEHVARLYPAGISQMVLYLGRRGT